MCTTICNIASLVHVKAACHSSSLVQAVSEGGPGGVHTCLQVRNQDDKVKQVGIVLHTLGITPNDHQTINVDDKILTCKLNYIFRRLSNFEALWLCQY